MPDSRERAAEILHGPDGERDYLLLLDYAQQLARQYGWRAGKSLPQSASPKSVANQVIVKVLTGERTWDETKEPSLLSALKGMVKSDMGHLFSAYETEHVESIDRTLTNGVERTADSFESRELNPEELLLKTEQVRLEMAALELILKEVEGNPELESVFLALYDSGSSEEISRLTGIPVDRVYSLCREVKRIAARISPARVARAVREKEGRTHEHRRKA